MSTVFNLMQCDPRGACKDRRLAANAACYVVGGVASAALGAVDASGVMLLVSCSCSSIYLLLGAHVSMQLPSCRKLKIRLDAVLRPPGGAGERDSADRSQLGGRAQNITFRGLILCCMSCRGA